MIGLLSWINSTLYDGLPYAIVTISFVLTLKYIRFPDITCASTFVLGAATAAATTVYLGWRPAFALTAACLAGAAGGALTATLHIVLRIDRLLAGILAAFSLYSVNLTILRPTLAYGTSPTVLSSAFELDRELTLAGVAWHPYAIGVMLVIVLCVKWLLDWILSSEFGLALRSLEDEEAGSAVLRGLGLGPARFQVFALVLGNALVALAGAVISVKEGAANLHRGFDILITGLIAFLLGTQLRQWVPDLVDRIATYRFLGPLRVLCVLRRVRYTTLAATGALLYFGIVALAYRTGVPSALTKVLLAMLVALTVGDYGWLRSQWTLARARRRSAGEVATERSRTDDAQREGDVALRARDLTYTFAGAAGPIFSHLSLDLRSGELLHLKGQNGTGKTTLLRLLTGEIEAPDKGSICLDGEDLTFAPSGRRRRVAHMAQDTRSAVVGACSVLENLALAMIGSHPSLLRRALRKSRRDLAVVTLKDFGRDADMADRLAGSLSGGERQLVSMLRHLLRPSPPAVLLLDEPFNNLDVQNVDLCLSAVGALLRDGTAVVLVNHLASLPMKADRTHELGPSTERSITPASAACHDA